MKARALTSVKTVAFRPMPSESARTATAEYHGSLAMSCRAYRRSLNMAGRYGSDADNVRGPARLTALKAVFVGREAVSGNLTPR